MAHRASLPPTLARVPTPFEAPPPLMLDSDLRFAASMTALRRSALRKVRRQTAGAMKELTRRWASVDGVLCQLQTQETRAVIHARDIGFVGLLVLLLSWGDTQLPRDFLFSMPAVGTAPWHGVIPAQPCEDITLHDVLSDAEANAQERTMLFCCQSLSRTEAGFATMPMCCDSEVQLVANGR